MQEGFDSWVVKRATARLQQMLSTKFHGPRSLNIIKKIVAQIRQPPWNSPPIVDLNLSPRTAPPPLSSRVNCLVGIAWRARGGTDTRSEGLDTTRLVTFACSCVSYVSLPINRHEMLCREQLRWKNFKLFYPTGKVFAVSPVSDLITRITLMNQGKDRNL